MASSGALVSNIGLEPCPSEGTGPQPNPLARGFAPNHTCGTATEPPDAGVAYIFQTNMVFSVTFTFAICCRPSVCRLSVTFVRPTQPVEIFGNVATPFGTLAIR